MSRKSRQVNHAAIERFILLPEFVLLDRCWRISPTGSLPILIDICKRWNGRTEWNNNGRIGYGCRTAAEIGISKNRAGHLLDWLRQQELIAHGAPGDSLQNRFFADGRRRQREWRITFFPTYGATSTRRESAAKQAAEEPGRRIKLQHFMLNAPAYVTASSAAKTILFELMRRFDGGNNGDILFGGDDARAFGIERKTAERALNQLRDHGFIIKTAPAQPWCEKPRKWLLTMYPVGRGKASKEFMKWTPENQFACTSNDANPPVTVPQMTPSTRPPATSKPRPQRKNTSRGKGFDENSAISDSDIRGTVAPADSDIRGTHIEPTPLSDGPGPREGAPAAPSSPASPISTARTHLNPPWNGTKKSGEIANSTEEPQNPNIGATTARAARGRR